MNRLKQQFRLLPQMWAVLIFCLLSNIQGAPPSTPGTNVVAAATGTRPGIPQSVFIVPSNSQEGRDPFYPYSNRGSNTAPNPAAATNLVLKGISGTPNRRLAIINNRTFEQGEEGEVSTTMGRIWLRCVEIKAEADTATVEVGGLRHVLHLSEVP